MEVVYDKADPILPPTKTKPETDVEILASISPSTLEDSFVYVHCHFNNTGDDMLIRIWKTTFLVDKTSAAKSQLVHAENISIAPVWTQVPPRKTYSFLLVFGGRPLILSKKFHNQADSTSPIYQGMKRMSTTSRFSKR
jgi:hypothetical protein